VRVPVILHERLGAWNRQLRPRLCELPVRWFESRSLADLEAILESLAFPIVLIDMGRQPVDGLTALELVCIRTPSARTLVLDPEVRADVRDLARELGATHVGSGFVPPPIVASLIARWIVTVRNRIQSAGWSRTSFPETASEPWGWLAEYLGEPAVMTEATTTKQWFKAAFDG
jgi:hypothetical protein